MKRKLEKVRITIEDEKERGEKWRNFFLEREVKEGI